MGQVYSIEGLTPVVHPTAFALPRAVLIGDIIVGPGCSTSPRRAARRNYA
jgi:phenylacetic acid degradation protein